MRPSPLSTLLLCFIAAFSSFLTSSGGNNVAAASMLPGAAADLARDQGVPQSGEGPFPYVIVTSRALRDEFMTLARERVRNGIASRVRSLESLRSDYPVATDDPERVRHFLRDAYERWGTRWVLLGGDTNIIPPRYATLRSPLPERNIVSDWYYACLDGTWDADGDGLYGELAEPGDPGDQPDLEPELFLGRAPVRDKVEARRFVEKTLAYERRPADAFEHTTLLFAHRWQFGDLAQFAEGVLPLITDDPAQQVTRLYESFDDPLWVPGALPETRQTVREALDRGYNVVVGYGVGSPELLGVGTQVSPDPQLLTVADVLDLANGDRAGHVWLCTSLAGAFDQPTSIAEAFLRAPAGGAVSVIAPSDLTFITQNAALARRFVEVVFDEGASTIGEALVRARAPLVSSTGGQPIAMAYQLLGDPLLRVFHESPVAAAGGTAGGGAAITGLTTPGDGTRRDVTTGLRAIEPAADADRGARHEPASLALSAPIPSPAVSSVRVECALPAASAGAAFDAAIVDLAGRVVRSLSGTVSTPQVIIVTWDLHDSGGLRASPGIYFLRVRAGGSSRTTRLVVAAGP